MFSVTGALAENEKGALEVQQARGLWWTVTSHTEPVRDGGWGGPSTLKPEDVSERVAQRGGRQSPGLGTEPPEAHTEWVQRAVQVGLCMLLGWL